MSFLPSDPVEANRIRRARADAFDNAHKTQAASNFMAAADLAKHDQLTSAQANLHACFSRLGKFESHLTLHPQSDSGWQSYDSMYMKMEGYARTIIRLGAGPVSIPARLVRPAASNAVTLDWLDIEEEKEPDQPHWMKDPIARQRRSEAIKRENQIATDLRLRKALGGA